MHLTLNERAVSTQYFFSAGVVVCAFSVVVLHAFCGYFSILFYVSSAGIVLCVFCGYCSTCLLRVFFYVSSAGIVRHVCVFCVCYSTCLLCVCVVLGVFCVCVVLRVFCVCACVRVCVCVCVCVLFYKLD